MTIYSHTVGAVKTGNGSARTTTNWSQSTGRITRWHQSTESEISTRGGNQGYSNDKKFITSCLIDGNTKWKSYSSTEWS